LSQRYSVMLRSAEHFCSFRQPADALDCVLKRERPSLGRF
jgi:hypothetical protein